MKTKDLMRGMPKGSSKTEVLLMKAIKLHRDHMKGITPPTDESQEELMVLLEKALEVLP